MNKAKTDLPPTARKTLYFLLAVYSINFVDRQILSVLIEPIKADLGLTDTQLGFLTGFAFALFYATLGVPIGRLADRTNRVSIISAAAAIWAEAPIAKPHNAIVVVRLINSSLLRVWISRRRVLCGNGIPVECQWCIVH